MFKKSLTVLTMALAFVGSMAAPVVAQAAEIVKASGDFLYVKLTHYMGSMGMILGVQSITEAFVQQFDNTIRLQAQQMESRLEKTVFDRGNITGESFTVNRLAAANLTPQKQGRHADTVWDDIEHSTRVALMLDYYQALPVDRNDEPKVLANPSGAYTTSLNSSWNRRKDEVIFNALIGNAQTKSGSQVALPSTQKIVAGGTGFTKAKVIQTKKIFRQNEADEFNGEELYFIYNAVMLEDILADTTLTSADFMALKMLQDGSVGGKWMGFNWIPYEAILLTGGTTYTTAAYTKSALHKGIGFFEGRAQRRGDKQDTLQLSAAGSIGAVRVEEEKVVTVEFV